MVSVDALGIYKALCIVELGLGEKAGLLQPLGQGLPAAADGEIGRASCRERVYVLV